MRPDRYLKLDGTSYHSTGLQELIEKPATKAGLVGVTAILTANLVSQESWDITTDSMMNVMTKNGVEFFLVSAMAHFLDSVNKVVYSHESKAVDTHGTSLDREQLSLREARCLKRDQIIWGLYSYILL